MLIRHSSSVTLSVWGAVTVRSEWAPRQPRLLLHAVCQMKLMMLTRVGCGTQGCVSKAAVCPFVSILPEFQEQEAQKRVVPITAR